MTLFVLAVLAVMAAYEVAIAAAAEDSATPPEVSPVRKFFNSPGYRWGMTFINFGIICFLFIRYARKPLLNFLDAQAKQVAETLERSRAAQEKAGAELREAIRQLAGVDDEKEQVIKFATEVSEKQRARILEGAERAAQRIDEQLQADVERARYLARKHATEILANQVIDAAEDHIADTLTPEDHAALVDRFIEQIDRTMVA
jgi:F-type H+-transporting ATPase subunit b